MIPEDRYQAYLQDLLRGERDACARVVTELTTVFPLKELYLHLFQRSMYEIGVLWETNRISVAIEHVATAITESLLHLLHPFDQKAISSGKKAVIGCCPGEFHQLGARVIADFITSQGWDTLFLGANTPRERWIEQIEGERPDLVGFSISIPTHLSQLVEMLETVRARFPTYDFVVGGQALRHGSIATIETIPRTRCLHSMDALEAILREKEKE